jgi:hypothetical protein
MTILLIVMELGKFIGLALLRFLFPVQLHYCTQQHAGEFPPNLLDNQVTNREQQCPTSLFPLQQKGRDRPKAHPALFFLSR